MFEHALSLIAWGFLDSPVFRGLKQVAIQVIKALSSPGGQMLVLLPCVVFNYLLIAVKTLHFIDVMTFK